MKIVDNKAAEVAKRKAKVERLDNEHLAAVRHPVVDYEQVERICAKLNKAQLALETVQATWYDRTDLEGIIYHVIGMVEHNERYPDDLCFIHLDGKVIQP